MNIAQFVKQLDLTISWVNEIIAGFDYQKGNYGAVLRHINPVINGNNLYNINYDYFSWNIDVYELKNFYYVLEFIQTSRSNKGHYSTIKIDKLSDLGRILCFSPLLTTHDGIAVFYSKGFVDESDVPPIDTWLYLESNFLDKQRPTLFCWIPKQFQYVMENAIEFEFMRSYAWLDQEFPSFYKEVESRILPLL